MCDHLTEKSFQLSARVRSSNLLEDLEAQVMAHLAQGEVPVRFAVTETGQERWSCDVGVHVGSAMTDSIFRFEKRVLEDSTSFNVVMLVPTGIGLRLAVTLVMRRLPQLC